MNKKNADITNSPLERQAGTSFSGYMQEISESLHGGFTEVTLYRQTATHQLFRAKRFGRWYLLKALPPELRGSDFHRQMLLKEMQVLMLLNHTNIVSCLGLEHLQDYTDSEGRLVSVGECLVLEFIEGDTLADYIYMTGEKPSGNHALDEKACEAIMNELFDALSYMHASSVTHRDLKPSNIMITHNGRHVKLIDFSLADTDSHAYLKHPSGTRQYMAPEQATCAVPDERNNIYSVGVIISQLPLGGYWKEVARRCQQPIAHRYPNIAALKDDVAVRRRRTSSRRMSAYILPPLLLLLLASGLVWNRFSVRQSAIYDELNRIPSASAQALERIERQIEATELSRHMDTISHWQYLDPQINEKILAVNAFAYDYACDSLPGFSEQERTQILQQMLDRWQQWHDNIVRRAKYLIINDGTYLTHYAEENLSTYSSPSAR